MHNPALAACGIDAGYVRLQVAPADFLKGLRAIRDLGFIGTNVTIPHKFTALDSVDEVAPAARRLDAAHAHARRALALDPLLPAAFNVLGVVAQLRLCIDDAQRLYRTALALDDRYGPARANLVNLTGFPKKLSAFEV